MAQMVCVPDFIVSAAVKLWPVFVAPAPLAVTVAAVTPSTVSRTGMAALVSGSLAQPVTLAPVAVAVGTASDAVGRKLSSTLRHATAVLLP